MVFGTSKIDESTICGLVGCDNVNPTGKKYCCAEHCRQARANRKGK